MTNRGLLAFIRMALIGTLLTAATGSSKNGDTEMNPTKKHHILKSSLLVYSGGPQSHLGVLPIGTSLRYVESFPEGFDRFIVFVNVERSPLPLEDINPPDLIDPLAAPAGQQNIEGRKIFINDDLHRLLRSFGVTRRDIEELLKSYEE